MAYSIRYGVSVKQKKRRDHRRLLVMILLLCSLLGRIFAHSYLDNLQTLLFGDTEAVAAFYEDFVKH